MHENLAHLARHHAVVLDRVRRVLAEDRPTLPRYAAEEDAEWPVWAALSTARDPRPAWPRYARS